MRLFKMSLALQMAIATVIGILCGLFFGDYCSIFDPYAKAYIMLLKMTAIPYLITAIMQGIGQLSTSQAKMILKKGMMFICFAWAINISMIYLVYGAYPQPQGARIGGYITTKAPSINFLELLIPENIFYDLSNNIVPAVVIFSIFIGVALMHLREKDTLMLVLRNLVETFTRITSWIAKITPYGTFLIIANQVGTIQFSTIKQVSTYIILYILCICILVFWVVPRLASMLTNIPAHKWIQQMFPILVLAYTTNVVIVCIPFIIELLRKETLNLEPFDDKRPTQIQGTVSVIFNLPLGSLFITVFVFFVSIFYNHPLSIGNQVELYLTSFLTSLGAVGIGSWINSLTFMLDSLGLPVDAVNLFLTALPFTSGFQSIVSTMEIATLSLLITLAAAKQIRIQYGKILKQSVLTIIPVLLLFGAFKTYVPLPEIKREKKSIYELSIASNIKVKVHDTLPEPPTDIIEGEDTFQRILRTKTLRVGYIKEAAPFSFYNTDEQIVGFDIAFAYELAYDLGCNLELVPMSYGSVTKELKNYSYDIAMSAISVNEERLKSLSFTKPYLQPSYVFVTSDTNKKTFSNLDLVQQNPKLKIGVLKGTSYEMIARELFPHNPLVILKSYDEFLQPDIADALLWEEQQAIIWTICHAGYRVIFPDPVIGHESLAYAIRSNNFRFLNYLNQWMILKQTEGYTKKQTDLWVLGKTEIAVPYEPRWSIIRNVLHWVD